MPRRNHRPRHTDRPMRDLAADQPGPPAPAQRPAAPDPAEHLEALRAQLRICSPGLYAKLIAHPGGQPYLHISRGGRDEQIICGDRVYRWQASGEAIGPVRDPAHAAHVVARTLGAPIREM